MTAELGAAFNYSDLQGLSTLRREAAADTPEARRAVAQQFEAMFLQMMLKEMRNASSVEGGLFDRDRMRFHEDMHDQQLALSLSQGKGIGLAESILRQFGDAPDARPGAATGVVRLPAPGASPFDRPPRAPGETVAPQAGAARHSPAVDTRPSVGINAAEALADTAAGGARRFDPATPREFVEQVWPHAERAAARLGVDPEVLVAQAALETGWGQHTIRDGAGRESHNLFGIKANGWSGRRATVATLEFVDGTPERRREAFRAYDSVAQSFEDYVALVQGSPRYRRALAAGSVEGYARALQAGGYATDPHYADKIIDIVRRGLPGRPAQVRAAAADNPSGTATRRPGADGGET